MPCQVRPVPFRKVNYLVPVGLPNIGGTSIYLFMPTLADAPCFCSTSVIFKFCLLSSQHPSLGSHPRKRSDACLCLCCTLIWGNAKKKKKSHCFTSATLLYKNPIDYSPQKARVSKIMLPPRLIHANADSKLSKHPAAPRTL